jgi:hypothetical protein
MTVFCERYKKIEKYIDKIGGLCYNFSKLMMRRSRLKTNFQRVADGVSAIFWSSTNGPLRAS